MSRPSQRLPRLVPGLYTAKDATQPGRPLSTLLAVLGSELDALARAIEQLWDDHFVERASPQALPLLAELLGARLLTDDPRVQRSVVARSVAWRRRKGTLAALEELLSLTSLWDAEVDEAFRSLLETQDLADPLPWRGRTAVLWDPIGLADPLSRRSPGLDRPRGGASPERTPIIGLAPGETIDQALRRLGRADAGRNAASPRTLDFLGWARPDVALVRSARLAPVELEEFTPATIHALPGGYRGFRVDPLDRDGPLVWLKPLERPDLTGGLTSRHEPDAAPPSTGRTAAMLLTPTALAEDPDAAERAGALTVSVDGIPLVGPAPLPQSRGPLPTAPVGADPALQLADPGRPMVGDEWHLTLVAVREHADIPLLSTTVRPGMPNEVTATDEANQLLGGTTTALIVERVKGEPRLLGDDGHWRTLQVGTRLGLPRSNVAVVELAGIPWVVRAEQHLATSELRITRFDASGDGTPWEALDLAGDPPPDGPGMAAAGDGSDLLLVAPDGAGKLGVWRVTGLDGTPTAARIDTASPRQPAARLDPSVCVRDGRLYVFGGDLGGAPTGDLWSIPLAGGQWRPHPVRHRQERKDALLLDSPGGLILIGGQAITGELSIDVRICDPSASSPAWRPLPPLPFAPSLPGTLVARVKAGRLDALVWADTIRPTPLSLSLAGTSWEIGEVDQVGAPNPPIPGEAVVVGDRVFFTDPAPLPPSEVIFTMGGKGHLAFLPELALLPDEEIRFNVANDGATFAAPQPGQALPLDARPGGAYHSRNLEAPAGERRHVVPGRLRRHPFVLRQRSLEPWGSLIPDFAEGMVALDPRLGRIVLPADAPAGRVTVSARVGRGASIGAGLLPPDRQPPSAWAEPDLAFPVPPDRPGDRSRSGRPITAWISPDRAGGFLSAGDVEAPIVATVEAGMNSGAPPVLGVIASPRLPPTRLATGADLGLSLFAADSGATPCFGADEDDGLSLAVYPGFGGRPDTEIWLAGLWITGRLELVLARGKADLRWCNLGAPGEVSLWIPGGGHQESSARQSLPPVEVELRLYGCMVGAIELPPWVRLIAAGCTFDAGSRDATAIRAAGARVRLRHCTVLGATEAGVLEASSCAFAGEVRVDRPDLGWLRYSVLGRGGRPPVLHLSRVHTLSFISARQTDPGYLVLAENNGPQVLASGERGRVPGAHGERADHERELLARTQDSMPIGVTPFHADRTTEDLTRMGRS